MSTVGALTSAYNSDPHRLQFDIIVYHRYFLSIFPSRTFLILRRFTYVCLFVHWHQRSAASLPVRDNSPLVTQAYEQIGVRITETTIPRLKYKRTIQDWRLVGEANPITRVCRCTMHPSSLVLSPWDWWIWELNVITNTRGSQEWRGEEKFKSNHHLRMSCNKCWGCISKISFLYSTTAKNCE